MTASETKEEAPAEPANPRRAPDVVRALKHAAKRDPHRDVLKPIGRICFLISLVVLAWLARPIIEPPSADLHFRGNEPLAALSRSIAVIQHVTQGMFSIDLGRLSHLDLEPKEASVLMLGGLFSFGFYYFAVYIVAMNAVRLTHGVRAVADASIRRARKIAKRLRKPESIDPGPADGAQRPVPLVNEASS